MKRMRSLLVVAIALAASAAGYWLGFNQAVEPTGAFMLAMRAPTSVTYLQAVQDGKIADYTVLMESDVDNALFINRYFEDSLAFRLLPPFWGADAEASRRESLTRLANYRKGHPSPGRPEALDALRAQVPESERANLPEITPAVRQSMLTTQSLVNSMVDRYADKPAKNR